MVISSLIVIPVLAWASFGFGEEVRTSDRVADSNASTIISAYFLRDVPGAASISTVDDCTGGEGDSAAGGTSRLLFSVVTDAVTPGRIAYTLAPSTEHPDELSIWRRSCLETPDLGDVTAAAELAKGITDSVAVVADCDPTPNNPTSCGEVRLSFPGRSGQLVKLSATKRSGGSWPS